MITVPRRGSEATRAQTPTPTMRIEGRLVLMASVEELKEVLLWMMMAVEMETARVGH